MPIGSALFLDGTPYRGNSGLAGELGHVIVERENGARCYCGQRGCFDTVCRAGVLHAYTGGSLEAFFRKKRGGDETAARLWDTYLEHLAFAIHNLRLLFDCSFLIGGYVGVHMEEDRDALCRRVDRLSIFAPRARSYIRSCKYGPEGTAAGAAIEVMDDFLRGL